MRNGHQEGVERVKGVVGREWGSGDATTPAVVGIEHPRRQVEAMGFRMIDAFDVPVFFVITAGLIGSTPD